MHVCCQENMQAWIEAGTDTKENTAVVIVIVASAACLSLKQEKHSR